MARRGALTKDPALRGAARKAAQAAQAAEAARSIPTQIAAPAPMATNQDNNAAPQVAPPAPPAPAQPSGISFKYEENKTAYDSLNARNQERYRALLANKGRKAANEFLARASGKSVVMPNQRQAQPTTPAPTAPPTPSAPPNEPAPGTPLEQLSPEEQVSELGDIGTTIGMNMGEFSAGFNPNTFLQQYQPQFTEAMDRARQSVMNQFEQRNSQAFAQERQDFETSMANRGIAPGGPQYNRELQLLNDRQDRARQEAMNAAEQAAQGVQAQAYQQATGVAMMPGEIFGQYQAPILTQYQGRLQLQESDAQRRFQAEQADLQRKFDEAIRRGDRASAERIARMARSGGGGGGGQQLTPYQIMEMNSLNQMGQQPLQPNLVASGMQGLTAGATQNITNRLNK
jgi:hypothetical protein